MSVVLRNAAIVRLAGKDDLCGSMLNADEKTKFAYNMCHVSNIMKGPLKQQQMHQCSLQRHVRKDKWRGGENIGVNSTIYLNAKFSMQPT